MSSPPPVSCHDSSSHTPRTPRSSSCTSRAPDLASRHERAPPDSGLPAALAGAIAAHASIASDRAGCLDGAVRGFERAAAEQPVHERSFAIADHELVLRFAGPHLVEPVATAFEHHPPGVAATGSRLTVHLWEASETAGLPWFPESARDGGITAGERTREPERIRLQYQEPARTLCVLDRDADTAYVCVTDATTLPHWDWGSPLRVLLEWWMGDHGRQLVHAAALGTEAGGVLLVGRGGAGKSTTALATLAAGALGGPLRFAGDDYCLVSAGAEPFAYCLYGTGKLNPDQAQRLPGLVSGPLLIPAPVEGEEKTLFVAARGRPDRMIDRFPLRALVVPMTGADRCAVAPIAGAVALRELGPSTVLQLPGAGARVLALLADLTRRVPSYALRLPPDPGNAPAVLAGLVERLGEG